MTTFLCLAVALLSQPSEPTLRFRTSADKEVEIVARLHENLAATLPMGRLKADQGEAILTLALIDDETKKPGPAMLGKYERNKNELTFTPRFPLNAGQAYRASFKHDGKTEVVDYRLPALAAKAPPKVVKIFPTTDVLPANHLKFYIYFDRPMRGGKGLFDHIVLVDDKGKVIDDPWLIDEIWDEENNCLILYIHPGRIKWGVELRELLGPVLYEKREYSLIIRSAWTDLDGNKIGKDFVKKFRTTREDRVRIDLAQWKLSAPKAGAREALSLAFPKPIDHRSLQRFLSVVDENDKVVEGTVTLGKQEMSWQFTPSEPWQKHTYRVELKGDLEDVAGNTPLRPFDLDLNSPKLPAQPLQMKFQPQ
jgi:hypothetical protein